MKIKGFQKIMLGRDGGVRGDSKKKRNTSNIARRFGKVFLIALFCILAMSLAVFFPARDLYQSAQGAKVAASEAASALKQQDIETAEAKLKNLEYRLVAMKAPLSRLNWVRFIPVIGAYQKDGYRFVDGGIASVQAAEITISTLLPYADLLGLKGKSTFVSGSADDRIRTAVETLDKIIPNVDKIGEKLSVAETAFADIDPSRYPQKIGNTPIRARLVAGKLLFAESASLFVEAQPLLKKLPELLGNKETKRYLVLFQNDAELRATGGFITAYGVFKVEKGKIQVEESQDIYKLDEMKNKKTPAPNSILKYHKNVFTLDLRDNNLSPDYVVSMKEFENMLKDSVPDFPTFDGIISLDTHVLVSTIKILGDFNVYGRTFSGENDPQCDCPKAIYELEDYATKPVNYIREERKDIIGVLLQQMMQKALGVSPSQYWGRLSQMFLEEAKQKHVLFYFHDSEAQKGIEALQFAGRIVSFEGDYIHISDVNFAGAKSNLFVKHVVKQDYRLEGDGTVTKTITISYKNPSAPSNCNLEAGQLCLNGILRNWVRIYVPKGSKFLEFKGSEKDTVSYDELEKTVFEGFLTVKPQGATDVIVRYALPTKAKKGDLLKILIQKQPGTEGHEYTILKDGREIEKFNLVTDREIRIKL